MTVHDGRSNAITELLHTARGIRGFSATARCSLFHRIVDAMVDHYRPEVEKLADRLDELEEAVFANPTPALAREILAQKRDVSSLRRVTTPQTIRN